MGRFRGGHNRDSLIALVNGAGGNALRGVGTTTTVVVAGSGDSAKHRLARSLGLPMISQDQLAVLMAEGSLEVALPAREVDASAEVFAEVRGLLNETPHVEGWAKLTRLLDRCPPEVEESAAHYAASYLDRWATEIGAVQRVNVDLGELSRAPVEERLHERDAWLWHLPQEHPWRLVPERWLGLLSQGITRPSFGLATAMTLSGSKLNGSRAEAIIKNPSLTGLRALFTGEQCRYSSGFLEALATGPLSRQLDTLHLQLNHIPASRCAVFGAVEASSALRTLIVEDEFAWEEDDARRAFGGAYFAGVTTLEVRGRLLMNDAFPPILRGCAGVRRVRRRASVWSEPHDGADLRAWLDAVRDVEVLCFASLDNLAHITAQSVRWRADLLRLNTRLVEIETPGLQRFDTTAQLARSLTQNALLRHVGAVWLGPASRHGHGMRLSPGGTLAERLEQAGITLVEQRPELA